jgi:hypothetical protein
MAEEKNSNLEPLEDDDLNLKDKFLGGGPVKTMKEMAETAGEKAPDLMPLKKTASEETPEKPTEIFSENIPESEAAGEKIIEKDERQIEKDSSYQKIVSQITSAQPVMVDEVENDADVANMEMDVKGKVENLVKLAETKGLAHAVKVAKHLEDNYALDEFHDRLLSEELHAALVMRGIIKPI